MAISGFVSLAGSLVAVWVGLNLMEALVSHAIRFVVGVGIMVGDSSHLIIVVGGVEAVVSRGIIVAVLTVRGSLSRISSRMLGDAPSHLTWK